MNRKARRKINRAMKDPEFKKVVESIGYEVIEQTIGKEKWKDDRRNKKLHNHR